MKIKVNKFKGIKNGKGSTHISILISLFVNIYPMQDYNVQEPLFLTIPDEIKLYSFEILTKDIIGNNSVFKPFNNVKEAIDNISLTHSKFNNLRPNLIKFAKKYIKVHFATEYVNLLQEKKDERLYEIFKNADTDSSKKLEIAAAKLIIAGANPNLLITYNKSLTNFSLLTVITQTGSFKNLINLLIKYGIDVNAKNDRGYTALMWAAINGYADMAKLLICAGSDVNAKSYDGDTALINAAVYRNINIIRLLINANDDINIRGKGGYTALIWSARYGYTDIVELLINTGADINIKNNNCNTALIYAAKDEYIGIVKLLLASGADVNTQCDIGNTALIWATCSDHIDIVKLLMTANVDINTQNNNGNTALIWASSNGNIDIVKLLIKAGVDINAKNNNGDTALAHAIKINHKNIVKLLKATIVQ